MNRIYVEFKGGPLDGTVFREDEWPTGATTPGTEIVDKATGSLYRYHKPSSVTHPVYIYRASDSAGSPSSDSTGA